MTKKIFIIILTIISLSGVIRAQYIYTSYGDFEYCLNNSYTVFYNQYISENYLWHPDISELINFEISDSVNDPDFDLNLQAYVVTNCLSISIYPVLKNKNFTY